MTLRHQNWKPVVLLAALLGVLGPLALAGAKARAVKAPIANFTLPDLAGKQWSLHGQKDKRAVVLVFVSAECPMSNDYLQPLADLAKKYEPQGVAFALINANAGEDAQQIAGHAKEYRLTFPILRDEKHAAVQALKAEVNPEAFVLDGNFGLRYRGRIDDGYAARLKKNPRVTRHDLQIALDELLAGKPVSTPVTKAYGCPIPQLARRDEPAGSPVTFNRDVLPILQNQCQTCHRPGDVGPFSLMTYKQAVKWSGDLKEYTQNRQMPPWKPVDSHGLFQNERRLSDKEIDTLAKWVESGTPEGDARDLPPPRTFADGWHLGEPDLVLTPPEEFEVGASGRDLFRVFVLPTNLTEDKYVAAVEVRPGNRRVVHHTLNFIDTTGQGRKLLEKEQQRTKAPDEQDKGPGYSVAMGVGFLPRGGLGGWAPGQVPRYLPEGVGYTLPKGSDIALQVHYHRTGKVERDQPRIGLYFAKKPVTHRFQSTVIPGQFLMIPANVENYKVAGAIELQQDITLYTVMPHMHLLGKSIKATMTLPDGTAHTLINIKDWDYNWQETYFLNEPIKVPAGTRFALEAYYDNSSKNPLNPHAPPAPVFVGEQTTNEMCFVFLGATSDQPGRIKITRPRITAGKD